MPDNDMPEADMPHDDTASGTSVEASRARSRRRSKFRRRLTSGAGLMVRLILGGALSSGKAAPSLTNADDMTIYTAMLSGPENMPVFGDNQITPDQKAEIINYVQTIKSQADPGGANIGRIGPVSEGLVIWVVGI